MDPAADPAPVADHAAAPPDATPPAPADPVPPAEMPAADAETTRGEDGTQIETVTVTASKPISAASAVTAGSRDLELRPLTRPGDVAEIMPGLFAVQHAGGGKANQYFVRGFDADHGTDVAINIDGVPVNMVSHAHGQGYADLNMLIPELVSSVDARKGPYEVTDGDLATAGALDMHLVDEVTESRATATYGSFDSARGLVIGGVNKDDTHGVVGAAVDFTNGPFDHPENFLRYNAYSKVSTTIGPARFSVAGSAYGGSWDASGENPLRAVSDGSLSYWGTEDTSQGGQSERRQLWGRADIGGDHNAFTALVWVGSYKLNLFSNFTFYEVDPVHGDEIEQADDRTFSGFDASWRDLAFVGPFTFVTAVGTQGRHDAAASDLYRDEARERLSTTVDDNVDEARIGVYARGEISWSHWVRLVGGARLDSFDFAVVDNLDVPGDGVVNGGEKVAMIVSPKANLIVTPVGWIDLFLNYGRGFHSNDARGVVEEADPVTPLTAATGYEAGTRFHNDRWGQVAVAAWGLDLDQETVWAGDEGTTELNGPTHRQGLDVSVRATPLPWILVDADLNVCKAIYTEDPGNANQVALAPPLTFSGGVEVDSPIGVTGGFRVRSLADRPATEDGSLVAEGWTIVDAEAGYKWHFIQAGVQVNNVLNTPWKEVQFASTTQLKDESAPVDDITFTPGWPRTILGTLTVYR